MVANGLDELEAHILTMRAFHSELEERSRFIRQVQAEAEWYRTAPVKEQVSPEAKRTRMAEEKAGGRLRP